MLSWPLPGEGGRSSLPLPPALPSLPCVHSLRSTESFACDPCPLSGVRGTTGQADPEYLLIFAKRLENLFEAQLGRYPKKTILHELGLSLSCNRKLIINTKLYRKLLQVVGERPTESDFRGSLLHSKIKHICKFFATMDVYLSGCKFCQHTEPDRRNIFIF